MKKEEINVANDGWFKCENENCDYEVKVLVPYWTKVLSTKCPRCGGKLKKK